MLRSKSTSESSLLPSPISSSESKTSLGLTLSTDPDRCYLSSDHARHSKSHSDQLAGLFSPGSEASCDSVFMSVTDEQIQEFKDVFRIFDVNQDGMITSTELIKILRSCGLEPTVEQVEMLIENMDTNGNGVIEFPEFVNLMVRHGTPNERDLKDAFKVFDQDNNGFMDASVLQRIMTSLGENLTMEQVEDMVSEADLDGNGQIDCEEFMKMMSCVGEGVETRF